MSRIPKPVLLHQTVLEFNEVELQLFRDVLDAEWRLHRARYQWFRSKGHKKIHWQKTTRVLRSALKQIDAKWPQLSNPWDAPSGKPRK